MLPKLENASLELTAPEKTMASMPIIVTSATGSLSRIYKKQVMAIIMSVIPACVI